jgi:hypothetical protein
VDDQERQKNSEAAEPKLLYHYTSMAGFVGILESLKLWASGIRFLNDASEFQAGMNAAFHVYNEELLQTGADSTIQKHTPLLLQDGDVVFVASFSAEKTGDDLSQWRAYSGGLSGVSLGFSPSYLRAIIKHFLEEHKGRHWYETELSPLVECEYHHNVDALGVDQKLIDSVKRIAANDIVSKGAEFAHYSATLKHDAFHGEKEWRIVLIWQGDGVPDCLEFRCAKSMLIPYIRIPLDWRSQPLEIDRVVIGPTPHQREAESAVRMLLKRHGVACETVAVSDAPYRNW